MSVNKEDYIGKRLPLSEIRSLFPNKWAIVKDYVFENGDIEDGVLVEVLDFEDMLQFMKEHRGERLFKFRTTDNMNVGYINGVFINVKQANKENYIGKRLSLKEIKILFPDKWAIVKDYVFENGSIEDGVLVEVLDFEDANKFMQAHMGERLYRFRTTENMNTGYINGLFINKDDYISKRNPMVSVPSRQVVLEDYIGKENAMTSFSSRRVIVKDKN
jgi:hypothetical protein